METLDKAVSTEDFTTEPSRNVYVEAAKLEAILNALVDHKVESIKNEKTRVLGSPKQLITRLRITSTSSSSLKERDNSDNSSKRLKFSPRKVSKRQGEVKKCGPRKCRLSSYTTLKTNNKPNNAPLGNGADDDDENTIRQQEEVGELLGYDAHFLEKCVSSPSVDCDRRCCCSTEEQQKKDYVSLKIEDLEDDDESEVLRRMRRKRRRRRKKKLKRLAITTVPVVLDDRMKVIDPDELPQRARWTIVATACLLLFMCLLLVGVTLRMAPIIDDMVRKENEELMKSLNREPALTQQQGLHNTSTRTVPR